MPLRQYQKDVQGQVFYFWNKGKRTVMPVLPTGSGKTKIMADTATYKRPGTLGLAMAHRGELVGQISVALAGEGLQHNLIASKGDIRTICDMHMEEYGRVLYNPTADWNVASVDSLRSRNDTDSWAPYVSMAFGDEGHHFLADNKWGREHARFFNAYWMLPTATPERADKRGLGVHASGVVDALVTGPDMRWMIDNGFLTNFVVRTPTAEDLDLSSVEVGESGEYKHDQMVAQTKRSKRLVGDVVGKYLEHTPGKLAIVFAADLEHGRKITEEFNRRGVAAEFLNGHDKAGTRRDTLKRFRTRKTLVLVNVDLFGEGFDLPAIEVCIFARPTASYALFVQQWGRALRLMISPILQAAWDTYTPEQRREFIAQSEKPFAIIHDHVGNMFHFGGPPTKAREWCLDDVARKARDPNTVLMRACPNPMCQEKYERIEPRCPWCGTEPAPPVSPSGPIEVDGDLHLFTPEMLDELFQAANKVMGNPQFPYNASDVVVNSIKKNHQERMLAQNHLRELIPMVMPPSMELRKAQRRFFHRYGVDVLSAQSLGVTEANKLREKILADLRG